MVWTHRRGIAGYRQRPAPADSNGYTTDVSGLPAGSRNVATTCCEGGAVVTGGMDHAARVDPRLTGREHLDVAMTLARQLAGRHHHMLLSAMHVPWRPCLWIKIEQQMYQFEHTNRPLHRNRGLVDGRRARTVSTAVESERRSVRQQHRGNDAGIACADVAHLEVLAWVDGEGAPRRKVSSRVPAILVEISPSITVTWSEPPGACDGVHAPLGKSMIMSTPSNCSGASTTSKRVGK